MIHAINPNIYILLHLPYSNHGSTHSWGTQMDYLTIKRLHWTILNFFTILIYYHVPPIKVMEY
jgi:hypothetical protein